MTAVHLTIDETADVTAEAQKIAAGTLLRLGDVTVAISDDQAAELHRQLGARLGGG